MKCDHPSVVVRHGVPRTVEEAQRVRPGPEVVDWAMAFAPEDFVKGLLQRLVVMPYAGRRGDEVVVEVFAHDGHRRFVDVDPERAREVVGLVRRAERLQQRTVECQRLGARNPVWDVF